MASETCIIIGNRNTVHAMIAERAEAYLMSSAKNDTFLENVPEVEVIRWLLKPKLPERLI